MKNGDFFQQGDLLMFVVNNIPLKAQKKSGKTLAQGEATGHHHTVTAGEAELFEDNGVLYLRVNSDEAQVTHQEHNTVTLPKGDYQIGIVKEYDHFFEESRNVKD